MIKQVRTKRPMRMHKTPRTSLAPEPKITVERHTGYDDDPRLLVRIKRKQDRAFSLSLAEAALLVGLLTKELPAVEVRHVAEGGGR
jgi:hypothetical protein